VVWALGLCWAVWGARSFVSLAGHGMDMVHAWVGQRWGVSGRIGSHTRHCLRRTLLASVGIGMDAVRTWATGERFWWQPLGRGHRMIHSWVSGKVAD